MKLIVHNNGTVCTTNGAVLVGLQNYKSSLMFSCSTARNTVRLIKVLALISWSQNKSAVHSNACASGRYCIYCMPTVHEALGPGLLYSARELHQHYDVSTNQRFLAGRTYAYLTAAHIILVVTNVDQFYVQCYPQYWCVLLNFTLFLEVY